MMPPSQWRRRTGRRIMITPSKEDQAVGPRHGNPFYTSETQTLHTTFFKVKCLDMWYLQTCG